MSKPAASSFSTLFLIPRSSFESDTIFFHSAIEGGSRLQAEKTDGFRNSTAASIQGLADVLSLDLIKCRKRFFTRCGAARKRNVLKRRRGEEEVLFPDADSVFSRSGYKSSFQDVLEFADIAGPRIFEKPLHRAGGYLAERKAMMSRKILKEPLRVHRNQFGPGSQRGNRYRDDIDSSQEILPEFPGGNEQFEISVRGEKKAQVGDEHFTVASKRLERSMGTLNDAKKHPLHLEGYLSDFVEKERLAGAFRQESFPIPDCSRERASDMSEELGTEKFVGKGRAVHLDHLRERRGRGDGAGHLAFAGSRFAHEQNRDIGFGGAKQAFSSDGIEYRKSIEGCRKGFFLCWGHSGNSFVSVPRPEVERRII